MQLFIKNICAKKPRKLLDVEDTGIHLTPAFGNSVDLTEIMLIL